jgi:hypothetical protein
MKPGKLLSQKMRLVRIGTYCGVKKNNVLWKYKTTKQCSSLILSQLGAPNS